MDSLIRFTKDVCQDPQSSQRMEWLETNGLGGFASSSITGMNTRRYHGLLTAATKPPVGRMVLLSKLEETLVIDGARFDLSANQYPGAIHPQGYRHLVEFRLDPFPVFTYEVAAVRLEKCVFMVNGENTTVVEYRLITGDTVCSLEVRPLLAFRDYHSTTRQNSALNRAVTQQSGHVTVSPYPDLPSLHFLHNATKLQESGDWYHNFEYAAEMERGLDYREDLFNPFVLNFDLTQAAGATVIASIEDHTGRTAESARWLRDAEVARRQRLQAAAPCDDPLVRSLTAAADQFIVKRGELKTIIAGYHWFSDWGRDTMIALPGLTLVTGRHDIAKNVLLAFAQNVDQGMLPNCFPDAGEAPEYNTVDATLWFFEAVRAYLSHTSDAAFVRMHIFPKLKEIIEWHVRGTRHGIKLDGDGLLRCGEAGVQLTWMDAKIGDWVVTPRHGKPVEIQALWYNALCVMEMLASSMDPDSAALYRNLAARAKESFEPLFWNENAGCLFDVVNNDHSDAAIRPNQVFAVSLPHSMLSEERARQVVKTVQRELLTPLGLRTLAPGDANYRPHYQGGVWERDSAYHQGTVWPWLLGPFITAYLKAEKNTTAARKTAVQWLRGFEAHLSEAGLGQVSEIADADAPHSPRGCIAQAWSVAELLRAATEVFPKRAAVARKAGARS